jgi:hypothetical protein
MLEERTQFQWLLSDSTLNPSTCNLNQMQIPQIFCLGKNHSPYSSDMYFLNIFISTKKLKRQQHNNTEQNQQK